MPGNETSERASKYRVSQVGQINQMTNKVQEQKTISLPSEN